ncbi:hypothetical protein A2867_03980 [Candidatus Daviesbacteria bacterium RIFCSPHIGHO2_01_FULL_40_11]|uniref:Response regulatory domain-containing protein n=1 Tax=Candidatus Daviesbacteria bacterium RIFCSPHIGHO2_01_FULL_40_11 TaxID=1797762 RepID=A0A1F5JGC8_9BACT|nr:MAG: hypothetical protein A2867_03980 [Candidatus Daviesbacteria bacterium RIFCSPHIGHO2_01_FULL_40_11]
MQVEKDCGGYVLVVDDEGELAEMMGAWVRSTGYEVVVKEDPREALLAVKQKKLEGVHLCAVLSDYNMPNMMGSELIDGILAESPGTKVAFVTGSNGQLLEDFAAKHQVLVIEKPDIFQPVIRFVEELRRNCKGV